MLAAGIVLGWLICHIRLVVEFVRQGRVLAGRRRRQRPGSRRLLDGVFDQEFAKEMIGSRQYRPATPRRTR